MFNVHIQSRPSPVPLSGSGKKMGGGVKREGVMGGGPPALAGTREYKQGSPR